MMRVILSVTLNSPWLNNGRNSNCPMAMEDMGVKVKCEHTVTVNYKVGNIILFILNGIFHSKTLNIYGSTECSSP